eukprot:scaffold6362_cov378-Prasinococcus_capsulatus_cf.AAC.7
MGQSPRMATRSSRIEFVPVENVAASTLPDPIVRTPEGPSQRTVSAKFALARPTEDSPLAIAPHAMQMAHPLIVLPQRRPRSLLGSASGPRLLARHLGSKSHRTVSIDPY